MKYRYNILSKFYKKNNKIILKNHLSDKTIEIGFNENIYNFLVFLEENINFTLNDFLTFNLSESFLSIFINFGIIIEFEFNSGIEAIVFDKIISNPSNLLNFISEKKINKLYTDVEKGIIKIINPILSEYKFDKINLENKNIDLGILNNMKSTRISKNGKDIEHNFILSVIYFIFKPRNKKKYFDIERSFFKFGSGGGLNSIFPILITKDDIYIYEKFQNKFFNKKINGISKVFTNKCLVNCDINFNGYNGFILLFSYTKNVFKKYGNRGYRLLHLECGEISFMIRFLYGAYNKPYLEIQGFYENEIYKLIDESGLFSNTNDLLLLHTIALTD